MVLKLSLIGVKSNNMFIEKNTNFSQKHVGKTAHHVKHTFYNHFPSVYTRAFSLKQ